MVIDFRTYVARGAGPLEDALKDLPTPSKVICDWGERRLFGKVKNWGAIGYHQARAGHGRDTENDHFILVEIVLFKFHGAYEDAIKEHVRSVLEIEVESLADFRRWPSKVPLTVWDQFHGDVAKAIESFYGARRTLD